MILHIYICILPHTRALDEPQLLGLRVAWWQEAVKEGDAYLGSRLGGYSPSCWGKHGGGSFMVADGSVVAAACSYLRGIGNKERNRPTVFLFFSRTLV